MPSGAPTFAPTSPTFQPTSVPSSIPSGQPTSAPSISFAPTLVIEHIEVSGNITIDRNESDLCKPVELNINIEFDRPLQSGQSIYLDMPGFTNGPCTVMEPGFDFHPQGYVNSSALSMLYYDGTYEQMYRDSQLRIYIEGGSVLVGETNVQIKIDRDQGFKFHCMQDTAFEVRLRSIGTTDYFEARGALNFLSFTPRFCFAYNTSLSFFPAHEQFFTQVNLTLQLATDFKYGDNITLYLPGFTNGAEYGSSYSSSNSWGRTSSSGVNAELIDIWAGGRRALHDHGLKEWKGLWFEGTYSTSDMFGSSYLTLWIEPGGDADDTFIHAGEEFYIVIDRVNRLSSYCGRPEDYSGFQVGVYSQNTTLTIPVAPVMESDPIGPGCPRNLNCSRQMAVCSDRGTCDYCTQQCTCFDGFGSPSDRAAVEVDNFPRDCSGKICPFGVSFGSLVSPSGSSSFSGAHPRTECSSAGICDRATGECQCFDGYTGAACQRRTCPGNPPCSGRGRCYDMWRLATMYEAHPLRNSTSSDHTYYAQEVDGDTWDAKSVMGCLCDSSWAVGLGAGETQLAEFFGPDVNSADARQAMTQLQVLSMKLTAIIRTNFLMLQLSWVQRVICVTMIVPGEGRVTIILAHVHAFPE
eukprot:CAMPEP_0185030848 /NCGR_PEP_ID=MMETSP1103-20130426/17941_1 /TAXON_ID=36769 /ORGANISM="Paraphysomonas bandaiensis, Strain Caron Lab Isolate" /LENGTH=634 /DNA_ID=CAMNT_0027566127 /DNA_START=316 /DNA_END=2221 /DNA_ORIENTATION=+